MYKATPEMRTPIQSGRFLLYQQWLQQRGSSVVVVVRYYQGGGYSTFQGAYGSEHDLRLSKV